MQAALTAFGIRLLIALLEKLLEKGSVEWNKLQDMKDAVARAKKYNDVINNPDSSLEDRLKAEDELGA